MSDDLPTSLAQSEIPLISPRWSFFKGLVVGAIVEVPAFTSVLWWMGQQKLLATSEFMHLLRLTASFAGVAAVLTAGGVGRVAANASVQGRGGRLRSTYVAAATHAVAGIGIAVIAAVASELFTPARTSWTWIALAGVAAGAVCGALIGVTCGGPSPIRATDLYALAKKPTDALFQILDPDDLVRLGTKVKDRATQVTTDLVDGLFDPAELPPDSLTSIPAQKNLNPTDPPIPSKRNTKNEH
ncbi:MAG: hypothetical protein KBG15_15605 [Kofleriaceae bacterium]|nr:hypothetical protein [Kofleriaceae bacterium]